MHGRSPMSPLVRGTRGRRGRDNGTDPPPACSVIPRRVEREMLVIDCQPQTRLLVKLLTPRSPAPRPPQNTFPDFSRTLKNNGAEQKKALFP